MTIKIQERINFTRQVDKQMRSKKQSNITKPIKWQELLHTFQ
jgi:hypothetical protein